MTKRIFLILLSLFCSGCTGMLVSKSGFDQSDETLPFFQLVSTSKFKEAYSLLCPIVRNATDYKAFETTLSANPFMRQVKSFRVPQSQNILGSDVLVLTGWLDSGGKLLPAEMTVATQENARCLLAVTVLGSSILPPFAVVPQL